MHAAYAVNATRSLTMQALWTGLGLSVACGLGTLGTSAGRLAVANRPESCRTHVGDGGNLRATLHSHFKPLKARGQFDCRLRHHHGRTRSNTRPRNQKFNTPAHSA